MTELADTAQRYMCRNPKCRSKLPTPVSNPREAFCARGCHSAFYRTHCRVCEEPIEQPGRGERLICRKAACIRAFRESSDTYRYQVAQTAESISETPDFIDSKQPLKPDRGWFIVAGPEQTTSQFHCALVGARTAVDEVDRANAVHWRAAQAGEHGYRRPGAVTVEVPVPNSTPSAERPAMLPIPADLSIPAFLDGIVPIDVEIGGAALLALSR